MALSVDHGTLVITVPQADLTFVTGTFYRMDTEGYFRAGVIELLDDEDHMVLEDAIVHNTEVTVAGVTYARFIELVNGYSVTFTPDSAWTVELINSNNNLFDVENGILNQNNVQVIPGNSAGLISSPQIADIWGHVRRAIYIDTTALTNGNGYQGSPFDNFTDAVDSAEAAGITKLVLLADAVADRDLKNFTFEGIGSPALGMNSKDFKGSHFISCELDGTIVGTGPIRADRCILRDGLTGIDGRFENCGFGGDLFLKTASLTYLIDCYSTIGGISRPSIDVGGGGCDVSLRSYRGGMTIKGADNAGDMISIEMAQGRLTLDSSNIDGLISVRGLSGFTDNSNGSTVDTTGLQKTNQQQSLMDYGS